MVSRMTNRNRILVARCTLLVFCLLQYTSANGKFTIGVDVYVSPDFWENEEEASKCQRRFPWVNLHIGTKLLFADMKQIMILFDLSQYFSKFFKLNFIWINVIIKQKLINNINRTCTIMILPLIVFLFNVLHIVCTKCRQEIFQPVIFQLFENIINSKIHLKVKTVFHKPDGVCYIYCNF